ncbi:transporter [Tepiditoga spiralis]|uniref:Transporter n=1 Tax=Tepiditoga spiralis TaxID=2108365 RepID=A0A7G1G5P1_9BACT|nr:ATP-binding protein [Tepiditoga spiralis]BBE31910.1 transporter [Tepiditoga spiralis]
MLIQFNFKNFKSYKNEVSLDLSATSIKDHEYNLIHDKNEEKFLKIAAIYGPNAGGKSNIIEAFRFMRYWVLSSFKEAGERKGIPLKCFAFDEKFKNGKSEFEVFFKEKGYEYQYGFLIDDSKVYEEWLYKRDFRGKNKYNIIFERKENNIKSSKFLKKVVSITENIINGSTLFLSFLGNINVKEIKNVFDWFREIKVINFGDSFSELIYETNSELKRRYKDKKYIKGLVEFLKSIDIDIEDIMVKERISNNKKTSILYSKHYDNKKKLIELPFDEESDGTKKMLLLYNIFYDVFKNGETIFIDELDSKLHPILMRKVIAMFHDEKVNKNNSQLIFTTHNVVLLTKDLFRRDEIWFAEKKSKESKLYSLVEFKVNGKKVRNDASYDKDYLKGKYGAIPIVKDFYFRAEKNE